MKLRKDNIEYQSFPLRSNGPFDKEYIYGNLKELISLIEAYLKTKLFTVGSYNNYIYGLIDSCGDVDILIDKQHKDKLESILQKISSYDHEYIGSKKVFETLHTIFNITISKNNAIYTSIQIDFNFVDFIYNRPTDFAMFAHYSAIEDTRLGIKGVFHKYLVNSILTSYDDEETHYRFSAIYGVRNKFKSEEYITDLETIFKLMFPEIMLYEWENCFSFVGLIYIMITHFSQEKINTIFNTFIDHLHGKNIEENIIEDTKVKNIASKYFKGQIKDWHIHLSQLQKKK